MKRPWPFRIYSLIGMTVLLFGVVTLIGGQLGPGSVGATARVRFPFGEPSGIAVDAQGHIFVVDDYYDRVQRFSPDGEFEFGWPVGAHGPHKLRVAAEGTIEVAVSKASAVFVFDGAGTLRERRPLEGDVAGFNAFAAGGNGEYFVRGALSGRPGIYRTADGTRVVADPWSLAFVRGPLPAFGYIVLGIAMLGGFKRRRAKGKHESARIIESPNVSPVNR